MTEQEIAVKDALLRTWGNQTNDLEAVLTDPYHDVIIYKKVNEKGETVYQGHIRNFDLVRNGNQQIMRVLFSDFHDLDKLKDELAKIYAHDFIKNGGMVQ